MNDAPEKGRGHRRGRRPPTTSDTNHLGLAGSSGPSTPVTKYLTENGWRPTTRRTDASSAITAVREVSA